MKDTQTTNTTYAGIIIVGSISILLLIATFVPSRFLSSLAYGSRKAISKAKVEEQVGYRITALARFDQERQARLRQDGEKIFDRVKEFVNSQPGRMQEAVGLAIAQTGRKVLTEQARLKESLAEAQENARLFNDEKAGRRQENLGQAILTASRRDPKAGNVFDGALSRETARLKGIEERTHGRLQSELGSAIAEDAHFRFAIPLLYQEAVQSARRSVRMLSDSLMSWALPKLNAVVDGLSLKRRPEDYMQIVGVVRENLKGNVGRGEFIEYGFPALAGLLMAMFWVGATMRRDQIKISPPEIKEPSPVFSFPWQKEFAVMSQAVTVFSWPKEVVFGCNIAGEIGRHASKNAVRHVMILTDEGIDRNGLLDPLKASFFQAGIPFQVYNHVKQEVPDRVIGQVFWICKKAKTDLLVAVGGGSVIDTAKAVGILLAHGGRIQDYEGTDTVPGPIVPLYVLPTTSGCGSEASQFCVVLDTSRRKKIEIISRRIIPQMIFIDPLMTITMSPELTAGSGVDALANCIEAYFSTWASPLTDALALHAIRLIAGSLRPAVANGNDVEARRNMALAAFEAGLAFTNAHAGAVHALGHPISGMFDVPQRLGDVILLPHVMRYNMNANMNRITDVAVAMGEPVEGLSKREAAEKAVVAVQLLMLDIGLPTTLDQVGVRREAISMMSDQAMLDDFLKTNPRIMSHSDIEHIYENAFEAVSASQRSH